MTDDEGQNTENTANTASRAGDPETGPATILSGRRRWFTLVVLSLGVALIVIDGTIVNVALPVIIRDLDLDFSQAEWTNTLYSLVFAGLLITTGRLGDRLGRRKLFIIGVIVFVIGSLFAASATSAATLISARAVQGVGGALVLPSTLSTVNATFRGKSRTIAFAVWGSVIAGMAGVGPLLGGWLTTSFSWEWIFLVNLPVGAIILIGIFAFVPETKDSGFHRGLDVDGFLLSGIGLASLVFGLVEGRSYGWWSPTRDLPIFGATWPKTAPIAATPVAIVVGLVFLVLFVLWENHRFRVRRSALLDLRLFAIPTFRSGNIAALTVAMGEFGLLFALPLYLQNVLALSPLQAGYVLAAMAAGAFVSGAMAGRLSRKMRPAVVACTGLVIEAGGMTILAFTVHASTATWLLAVVLVVYGIGLGLASAQLTGVILTDVPAGLSGQGSATQSTMRQLGSALGVAVLGTVLGSSAASSATGSLGGISGLDAGQADRLESQLSESAGSVIAQVRVGAIRLPDGVSHDVVDALSTAFATGARITMLTGALCLVIGLISTIVLVRRTE